MGGIVGNMDLRLKTPDGRNGAISYKAVFNHSYHTLEDGTKELRWIACLIFFPTARFHPTPIRN